MESSANRAGGEMFSPGEGSTTATDSLTITHSILSAHALMEEVAEAYAIGSPSSCQLLLPSMNDTYLVSTPEDRFILRVYRARWRSLPEILYELELLSHLAERGVSVSLPIAARDGAMVRTLRAPEGHRHIVLFTYADGADLSLENTSNCHRMGGMAAAIHAASDDFNCQHSRTRLDLEYLIDASVTLLQPFFVHRQEDWTYMQGFARRLRARAETMLRGTLDWGVCHGDLGGGNTHISDEGKLTVFDFDLCGPSWRAWDLAAIQQLATEQKESAVWDCFLEGYNEKRLLGTADLAAVPVLVAVRHLWRLGLQAGNVADYGILRVSDLVLDRELMFFREWENSQQQGQ